MSRLARWMIWGLGIMACLAPLKFGTPVVLQSVAAPPLGWVEWIFFSWPNQLGVLLCCLFFSWFLVDRQRRVAQVDLLLVLPIVFLVTQAMALPGAINPAVANATLMHLIVCVLLFYVAASYVRDGAALQNVFTGLGVASLLVCLVAIEQWMSGLELTRQYVDQYGGAVDVPPEVLARLESQRVFATLVYPNALAGYLLVAWAPVLVWVWVRGRGWAKSVKWFSLVFLSLLLLFCLVLTGSRGGFLAFGAVVATSLWFLYGRHRQRLLGVAILLLGLVFLAGLWTGTVKTSGASLAARLDYWAGALEIARDHPLRGTGPGTFGSIYPSYKTSQTEEAQLVHNNYLQMWCDSGVLAFVVFLAIWIVALRDGIRLLRQRPGELGLLAIMAALIGWVVHGLVDFDLYVPGVAYPAFILLGSVQGLKQGTALAESSVLADRRWLGWVSAGILLLGVIWLQSRSLTALYCHFQGRLLGQIDPARAYTQLQRAVSLDPDNSVYLSTTAEMAAILGFQEESRAFYLEAIKNDRYRASYHWRLAQVCDDKYHAINHLRRACELNPTRREYQQALQAMEESSRQTGSDLLPSEPAKTP